MKANYMKKLLIFLFISFCFLLGCSKNEKINYNPIKIVGYTNDYCDDSEQLYYIDSQENNYYIYCLNSIIVSYENIKLAEELKTAFENQHVSLDKIIELSIKKEKIENGTIYFFDNMKYYSCNNSSNYFVSNNNYNINYCNQ